MSDFDYGALSGDMLEYEFMVQAGEKLRLQCSIDKPFKLRSYHIERDTSTAHAVHFDYKHMTKFNAEYMNMVLHKPVILKECFSIISNNEKSIFADKVRIRLVGEYVDGGHKD